MAQYTHKSPWFKTPITQDYLDILKIRPVAAELSDYLYTIEVQYTYRPDLLAFDLYGDSALWWVFIQRNLDVLQDPIFDFVPDTKIYIPQFSKLKVALGI
jgi:Base plate wedge protein 53